MLLADCFLFLFLDSAGRLNAYGVFGEEASNANDAVSISSMPAAAVTGTERHDVTVLMTLVQTADIQTAATGSSSPVRLKSSIPLGNTTIRDDVLIFYCYLCHAK